MKIRGTKAKEENQRLRCEIKGADRAEGGNKMHDGENNVKGENKEVREKLKGTRAKEESKRL